MGRFPRFWIPISLGLNFRKVLNICLLVIISRKGGKLPKVIVKALSYEEEPDFAIILFSWR